MWHTRGSSGAELQVTNSFRWQTLRSEKCVWRLRVVVSLRYRLTRCRLMAAHVSNCFCRTGPTNENCACGNVSQGGFSHRVVGLARRVEEKQVCIDRRRVRLRRTQTLTLSHLHHFPLPGQPPLPASPRLSIDPDGPFRHLSIFNQPPPLTQQLPPNWLEIDYHQHHNGSVGQWQVLIKKKKNPRCKI